MHLKDFYPDPLTADQQQAVDMLSDFLEDGDTNCFLLKGYAGTGKTYLLKGLCDFLTKKSRKFQLLAPTGRAAAVLNTKTGYEAKTVHKALYNLNDLKEEAVPDDGPRVGQLQFQFHYATRNPDAEETDTVFIIDESSMVADIEDVQEFISFGSGRLLADLISYAAPGSFRPDIKLIFVGDPAQLPPVGMERSPALDPIYLLDEFGLQSKEFELKEVKRQGEQSVILDNSIRLRQCLLDDCYQHFAPITDGQEVIKLPFEDLVNTYLEGKKQIIITAGNRTAWELNRSIREKKWPGMHDPQPNDHVIVAKNNYEAGVMNGEFLMIQESSDELVRRHLRVYRGVMHKDVELRWRKMKLLGRGDKGGFKTVEGWVLDSFLHDPKAEPDPFIMQALLEDARNRWQRDRDKKDFKKKDLKAFLMSDPYFNCLFLKYGYAITCHKSQGGEWEKAFIVFDYRSTTEDEYKSVRMGRRGRNNMAFFRWAYTAMTRAQKNLYLVNPPWFTPWSSMSFAPPKVREEAAELLLTGNDEAGANIALPLTGEENALDGHVTEGLLLEFRSICQPDDISIEPAGVQPNRLQLKFLRGEEQALLEFSYTDTGLFTSVFARTEFCNSNSLLKELDKIIYGLRNPVQKESVA